MLTRENARIFCLFYAAVAFLWVQDPFWMLAKSPKTEGSVSKHLNKIFYPQGLDILMFFCNIVATHHFFTVRGSDDLPNDNNQKDKPEFQEESDMIELDSVTLNDTENEYEEEYQVEDQKREISNLVCASFSIFTI